MSCEPLKDDFDTWMMQLAFYHSVDCTTNNPDARCSCGLHELKSKIRAERNELLQDTKHWRKCDCKPPAFCSKCY
jgi:hypothetical protein